MRALKLVVIFFISTFTLANGQRPKEQDACRFMENCTACIRSRNCVWCDILVDERTMEAPVRCVDRQDLVLNETIKWCSGGTVVDPTTKADLRQDDKVGSIKDGKTVQIQPQIVDLKLRQGEEYRLKLRYRQAEDYPVDLYFLLDVSNSMTKFRNDLSKLTQKIVNAMANLTGNFQLGFGIFIDKNIRPMIYEGPKTKWHGHEAFVNKLKLTHEYMEFRDAVSGTDLLASSIDYPESGFDGMMQAIVCTDQIGWRPDARHLLVHASDTTPHIAGDGRLAGIVIPNDEECHLVNGLYTHAELQDYPSPGQINFQARENNINIIFATVKKFTETYGNLTKVIENSAAGTFDVSDDVVKLISRQYEKLVTSLSMTSNSTSSFIDVKFFSSCLARNETPTPRDNCDNVRVRVTVDFYVVIKAINCSEREEDWKQTVEIKPEGINERVIVNVELICGCKCSKKTDQGNKNPTRVNECHNHGNIDCGICSCDLGYYGKVCQCKGDKDPIKTDPFMSFCRKDNSSEICSGRGNCDCGKCSCYVRPNSTEPFKGDFCECDDFSCKRSSDGKLCGANGYCECGRCVCGVGWSGENCDCKNETATCLPVGDNPRICSGAGVCRCGECKCDDKRESNGPFCEDCPSCPSKRCGEFKDCVECQVHKSGKIYAVNPYCDQCTYDIQTVDKIEEDPAKIRPGDHVCRVAGEDGSEFVFMYFYPNRESKEPDIVAEKEKERRGTSAFLIATLGVVLLTLLIGLVGLAIWKVLTNLHDKREFEKFQKERGKVHWAREENPLYKTAITTFKNPTFDSDLEDEDL